MKYYLIIFTAGLFLSCNSGKQEKKNSEQVIKDSLPTKDTARHEGIYTIVGDSIVIPPFEIEIALSPKAAQRIAPGKETIIVDVFLSGIPKDSSKVKLEEDGVYYVGSASKEINYGEIASFANVKFPKSIYDNLADKDVQFDINVYSGRKSSPDNLLDVDFLSGKLSTLVNKRSKLNGKLIEE
jgi:hypothetical protein